ncbi:MAG: helix-turn-helix domain-containing protein [Actinomycetales bacterium]|nr:helix-turn-helix domain-containing protein [Actinomycetales bacterium]
MLLASHRSIYAGSVDLGEETSAARIVAVLEALAQPIGNGQMGVTASEIARRIGRDKSSVSRQMKTLVHLGLAEKTDSGKYILGWRVFTIAARAGDQRLLLTAPAVMRQIVRQTGESVHLSIRCHDEVLTILTESPMREVSVTGWVGRTVPLLGTSSGRALMMDDSDEAIRSVFEQTARVGGGSRMPRTARDAIARVAKARTQGYAVAVDEHEDGLSAVAAPIRDVQGRITAAINVSAPSYRIGDRVDDLAQIISRAAVYLSRTLAAPASTRKGARSTADHKASPVARSGKSTAE